MRRPSFSPSLCGLAWGLLLVASSAVSANEPQAAGVVRISKPAASDAGKVTIRGQSDNIELVGCKDCESQVYDGFSHGGHLHGGSLHGQSFHGGRILGGKSAGYGDCDCDECKGGKFGNKFGGKDGYYCDACGKWHGGKGGAAFEYFKCKFGFFFPTGCGGAGCPPIGKYARVYPQDPSYFDARDGQLYGAHGYGAPIAVPLAPVVGHQYNYSWGVPASRLTPISRIAP